MKKRDERFGRLSRGRAVETADFEEEVKLVLAKQCGEPGRFECLGSDCAACRELRAAI